jgi:hypothetical protein
MQIGRLKVRKREAAAIGLAAIAGDTLVGQVAPEYAGILSLLANFFVGG